MMTAAERLLRMQTMFDEDRAVLIEDYEFFTGAESDPKSDNSKKGAKSDGREE